MKGIAPTPRSFLATLDAPPAQRELFPPEEVAGTIEEAMAVRGDFTGAGFFRRHPKAYQAVTILLAQGVYGLRELADMFGVSVNTIRAVEANEPAKIDTLRKDLADRARRTARKLVIRIERDVDAGVEMSVRDMAVSLGILTQYSELLAGNATERVEVTGLDAADAFDKFLARSAPVDITDVAVCTGLDAQTPGPKAGQPAAIEAQAGAASPLAEVPAQVEADPAKPEPIPVKREGN